MSQAIPHSINEHRSYVEECGYDFWLIGVTSILVGMGLVMVASSSIPLAHKNGYADLYYFWRQLAAFLLGVGIGAVVLRVPLAVFEKFSTVLLFASVLFLATILIPGVGREVNGSIRWLQFGPISLQASEPAKLAIIVYVSSYLVRHQAQVQSEFIGFIKPVGVLTIISGLLLLEPDFGAAVVIFATILGMLFLGQVPFLRFIAWGMVALSILTSLALLAPYRLQRLMAFRDPWSDPYDSGFQLTQALIAFGRGEWFGVGLGNSIQKLFYLPEVHTDFLFAVVGEELGMLGAITVICLFLFLIWRIFFIGSLAQRAGQSFAAYLAYGIGLLIGMEAFINIGVNMGLLPTKGLTLPLMSYGSNSMLVVCVMLAMVLRVAKESRVGSTQGRSTHD
ncbi:MAG TPA: putative lipid II flippase FtsW [Gammaproteobacteria bacterium]|nr:putative lipid II flippase FtsW [Gammaproteobacteria bacterium]